MNTSLTIKARLGLTMAVLGLLLVLIGGLGLYGMNQTNVAYADTFTNQMPSAVAIESAELYAARERLVFDRAALAAGTPESAATLERGPMMRQRSNDEWAKYVALPMGDGEKALADTSYAKRMALQKVIDEGYEAVKANDQPHMLATSNAMQAAFTELATADEALSKLQFDEGQKGYVGPKCQLDVPHHQYRCDPVRPRRRWLFVVRVAPCNRPSARRSAAPF